MKKLSFYTLLFCLAAVCTFSLNSCQEFNIDTQSEFPPTIDIDAQAEYGVLAESPNKIVFNISSNTPWKIESDKDWCIPTPAMSAASSLVAEVSVNIKEYADENSDRTATLTITADGVEGGKVIKITQAAKGALVVTNFAEDFPSEGGEAEFAITANKAWKIINTEGWLTLDIEEGTGTGEKVMIKATVLPNEGLKRSATLTIVSNGKEKEIVATQKGGITLEFGEIVPEDLIFNGGMDKESKTYQVIAKNVDYEVASDAAWLKVEKNEEGNVIAISQSEIYFTTRKATITLNPKSNTSVDPVTMEVEQEGGAYVLDAKEEDVTVDEATGAVTFTENTGAANSRYYVNKARKLAIHEWHFSHIEVDGNRCLNMNNLAAKIPSWNFWFGTNNNAWIFRYRGADESGNEYSPKDTKATEIEINKLKALKVAHIYSTPEDKSKAKIEVYVKLEGSVDWNNVLETPDYVNLFETTLPNGNSTPTYFGFISGSTGLKGTVTISSYEVTNIE